MIDDRIPCFFDYGQKSFWEICPEYFHENTDESKQETDYVYRFLTVNPEDNKWGLMSRITNSILDKSKDRKCC